MTFDVGRLKFDKQGLIPAVVRNASSGAVLTLAYMNRESLNKTIEDGETWFWSRSRNSLWHKGETSGNRQRVLSIRADCDYDALVLDVQPLGPACHKGLDTCFHNPITESAGLSAVDDLLRFGNVVQDLENTISDRRHLRPANSYTSYLFDKGIDKILKKVGEEASETIIAAKNNNSEELVKEISDLIYHLLVLMAEKEISSSDIARELRARSGVETK
jgi:phosphoribosyl-ATP pyrophosphohydrolase/phosphoribosyl-AMP cyclohydrolase